MWEGIHKLATTKCPSLGKCREGSLFELQCGDLIWLMSENELTKKLVIRKYMYNVDNMYLPKGRMSGILLKKTMHRL